MSKTARQSTVEALIEQLKGSPNVFVTDFTGLNVLRMTELRRRLRGAGVDYVVVKNTLAQRAFAANGVNATQRRPERHHRRRSAFRSSHRELINRRPRQLKRSQTRSRLDSLSDRVDRGIFEGHGPQSPRSRAECIFHVILQPKQPVGVYCTVTSGHDR